MEFAGQQLVQGRMVYFVDVHNETWPATVISYDEQGRCSLFVMTTYTAVHKQDIPHSDDVPARGDTWHWPPRNK